jgi:catechol 2,3-dioxygenase-like lactoylglutathione lyase family enzyme
MSSTQMNGSATRTNGAATMDMKLEVIVLPVSDVDRAKDFYEGLEWRLDADFPVGDDFRVVQLTPPGSDASIIFGDGVTSARPGSIEGLQLVVSDIEAARTELAAHGADVSEVFHDAGGVFHHAGVESRVSGPAPGRGSYGSRVSFDDPDGNGWLLQEVTTRLRARGRADHLRLRRRPQRGAPARCAGARRAREAHGRARRAVARVVRGVHGQRARGRGTADLTCRSRPRSRRNPRRNQRRDPPNAMRMQHSLTGGTCDRCLVMDRTSRGATRAIGGRGGYSRRRRAGVSLGLFALSRRIRPATATLNRPRPACRKPQMSIHSRRSRHGRKSPAGTGLLAVRPGRFPAG